MRGAFRYILAAATALVPLCALGQSCQCRMFYVAASQVGTANGTGTLTDPFVLTQGREYDLNKAVQPILAAGTPLYVVFMDGTYQDVQLEIIKASGSSGAQAIYPIRNVNGAKSNQERGAGICGTASITTCRVAAADYTMSATSTAPLYLTAMHRGAAVFDGTDLRDDPVIIDARGISIAGSLFPKVKPYPYNVTYPKISGVTVDGLVFQNYYQGLGVSWAKDIVVKNCVFDSIGNRVPRVSGDTQALGVAAWGIDDDVRDIVFARNTVSNVYNMVGTFNDSTVFEGNAAADPSLIHTMYVSYARDLIFYKNTFTGSSGPMLKLAYYPFGSDATNADNDANYPNSPAGDTRNWFIGNTVTESILTDQYGTQPLAPLSQFFIHDNSTENSSALEGPGLGSQTFYNNSFINALGTTTNVDLVHQDVNNTPAIQTLVFPPGNDPLITVLPNWSFSGNNITNVPTSQLVSDRLRKNGASEYTKTDTDYSNTWGLPAQNTPTTAPVKDWATPMVALINGSLASDDAAEDAHTIALLQQIQQNDGI